ncbi:MAG: hypothetical protein KJO12_07605 [Ignavibacteria bacterium]|nr:hypothetical protein [Ignavibacteria bacterium]
MKLEILHSAKLVVILSSLLIVVTLGQIIAQPKSIKNITNNKYALNNLLAGIKSNNDGVKRSSIYFIGYYRIAEAEEALIEQLKKEQNPSNKILVALVLYELGSNSGLLEIKKLAIHDENQKVKRMSTHIYNKYLIKDSKRKLFLSN